MRRKMEIKAVGVGKNKMGKVFIDAKYLPYLDAQCVSHNKEDLISRNWKNDHLLLYHDLFFWMVKKLRWFDEVKIYNAAGSFIVFKPLKFPSEEVVKRYRELHGPDYYAYFLRKDGYATIEASAKLLGDSFLNNLNCVKLEWSKINE